MGWRRPSKRWASGKTTEAPPTERSRVMPVVCWPSANWATMGMRALMRTEERRCFCSLRDGGGDAEDDHVEEDPEEVGEDGAGVSGIGDEQPVGRGEDAEQIEEEHPGGGRGDAAVEAGLGQGLALVGDVELAELGIDQRQQRGQQDVGRQHGLVDLVPEGVAVSALDARVGEAGEREVRQGIGEDRHPVAGDDGESEEHVGQRRHQEDEARHGVEEVGHRVEVAEALGPLQAAGEERVVDAQDLDHAARPADALADVGGEGLGGQPGGLRDVDVGGVPAQLLHAQRGVRVLGDGLGGDAADLVEGLAADDGAGAAEEGGVPEVVAVLDDAVEELALVGDGLVAAAGCARRDRASRSGAASAAWPDGLRRANQPRVNCRKLRVGTWSQSKMATKGEFMLASAWLMLPALAWLCSLRVM